MEGKIPMVDFYKVLEIDDPVFDQAKGDSSTLAGFVIEQAGYIPEKGDEIMFEGFSFTIERVLVLLLKLRTREKLNA